MHVGLGGVDGLSVHQEHHARGVQLEPHLLDDAIEIELQSGGNLLRQDRITLLGAGGLDPLADAQNLHCHVSEVAVSCLLPSRSSAMTECIAAVISIRTSSAMKISSCFAFIRH